MERRGDVPMSTIYEDDEPNEVQIATRDKFKWAQDEIGEDRQRTNARPYISSTRSISPATR